MCSRRSFAGAISCIAPEACEICRLTCAVTVSLLMKPGWCLLQGPLGGSWGLCLHAMQLCCLRPLTKEPSTRMQPEWYQAGTATSDRSAIRPCRDASNCCGGCFWREVQRHVCCCLLQRCRFSNSSGRCTITQLQRATEFTAGMCSDLLHICQRLGQSRLCCLFLELEHLRLQADSWNSCLDALHLLEEAVLLRRRPELLLL